MSDLETKAVDLLDKLEALATNYAPDVAEAAVAAVRITAIGELILAVLFLGLVITCAYVAKKSYLFCSSKYAEPKFSGPEAISSISLAVSVAIGVAATLNFFVTITDIWVWTAVFNPELALAHKITGL